MPHSRKLLLDTIRNVAVIGILGYLLSRLPVVRKTFCNYQYRTSDQVILAFIFGTFSALGNWLGIPVFGAIANTRIVGPIVGGLLGGPLVGIGAGILGAIPRYFMGGYTVWASVVANVPAGFISGVVPYLLGERPPDQQSKKPGIGICNVDQRIKRLYGSDYGLIIESQENIGTKILIRLPWDGRELSWD